MGGCREMRIYAWSEEEENRVLRRDSEGGRDEKQVNFVDGVPE